MILRYHHCKDPVRLLGNVLKLHHYVLNTCYPVSKKSIPGSHSCENNKKTRTSSPLIVPTKFIRTIGGTPSTSSGPGQLRILNNEWERERQGRRGVMCWTVAWPELTEHWYCTLSWSYYVRSGALALETALSPSRDTNSLNSLNWNVNQCNSFRVSSF